MQVHLWVRNVFGLLAAAALLAVGCNKIADTGAKSKGKPTPVAKGDSKHEGWWCDEHGVPEEECSMCSKKAAAACKAKGDWCKEHDRAKSQCFICDPSLREKYAVLYRAKYGKEPPPPEDNMPKKDESKKDDAKKDESKKDDKP